MSVRTITREDGSRLSYGPSEGLTEGTAVIYKSELICDEAEHAGTVTAVEDDASGDRVVTVKFACGPTQDILASELEVAGYDWARYSADDAIEAQDWAATEAEMDAIVSGFQAG